MKILVVNSGSFSMKLELIETSTPQMERHEDRLLGKGGVDRMGAAHAEVFYTPAGQPTIRRAMPILGPREALMAIFDCMGGTSFDAAGHRIVHGGARFPAPARFTDDMLTRLEEISELAPLHNPASLKAYYALRELHPDLPQVAVFDTSFHSTLPERAYRYAIPERFLTEHRIRRYGFHGTSHRYVTARFAHLENGRPEDFRLITCHLGSGCSIAAIDRGRSIDTSMGFTPLEGLVMGTRSGDIDPAAVIRMMERENLTAEQAVNILNRESGLLALSGLSNDVRVLARHRAKGHAGAELAVEVFCYRIRKYIGAYLAVLNGADGIVFTGGVGEHRPEVRRRACANLDALGIALDAKRNAAAIAKEAEISAPGARVKAWVIPTHEELLIARDTARCLGA